MMDKVQVCVKVRGFLPSEKESGETKSAVKCQDDKVTVGEKVYPVRGFGAEVKNDHIYESLLHNTVKHSLSKGINMGVLCVGGSKSGKSTFLGTTAGIVSSVSETIFKHLPQNTDYFVGVSYLNIFNEKLLDMLNPADQQFKIKIQAGLGVYVEGLSEISVKSSSDLMRLFEQGNKVRKILQLEHNTPTTKSHTVLTISCEYKNNHGLVRSQIHFYSLAGLDHSKDPQVANSISCVEKLIAASSSGQDLTVASGSKITQLLRNVLDRSSFLAVIGLVAPTTSSLDTTTRTIELLQQLQQMELQATPNTLDTHKLIEDLRKRVAAARNTITAQTTGDIAKEHIAELDNSLAALTATKRLLWDERERASALAEEQRRQTLADQGVLEWMMESAQNATNSASNVLVLQREKDQLVGEYKKQRKLVEDLKTQLQSSITEHTSLAELPNQEEATLQDSLSKIHALRDQLKGGNEKLRDLKKGVKEAQDKLKTERSAGRKDAGSGNFVLTLMMKRDEAAHLRRDNQQFLEEEKERLQSEAEQEVAEIKLNTTQGNTLTLEQVMELQEELANNKSQLSHLALHVQCLQAEVEKTEEIVEALNTAHQAEADAQKARNLLTFRQYKDFYEEAKMSTSAKYQELLNSCIQDCIFLSSKNAELAESNTELKKKLKHFS